MLGSRGTSSVGKGMRGADRSPALAVLTLSRGLYGVHGQGMQLGRGHGWAGSCVQEQGGPSQSKILGQL